MKLKVTVEVQHENGESIAKGSILTYDKENIQPFVFPVIEMENIADAVWSQIERDSR